MILTVDIGNTRVKSAQWLGENIEQRLAVAYDSDDCSAAFEQLLSSSEKPSRVLCVCVAGEVIAEEFSVWVQQRWQLVVEFLQTEKRYKNIVHAYRNPDQHGADRWASLVAACQHYPENSVCVIGAGTAITFDLVNKNGQHLGGYILPSYATMHASLINDTANVLSVFDDSFNLLEIPDNTNDAVNQGCHRLLQSGIRDICQLAESKLGAPVQTVITGGNAENILHYSGMSSVKHEPDLVMQGLYTIMLDKSECE